MMAFRILRFLAWAIFPTYFPLLLRDQVVEKPGRGAAVLGGADEGQISGVPAAEAKWKHGATRPGNSPDVRTITLTSLTRHCSS